MEARGNTRTAVRFDEEARLADDRAELIRQALKVGPGPGERPVAEEAARSDLAMDGEKEAG